MDTCGWADLNMPLPAGGQPFQDAEHRERLAAALALGYRHVGLTRTVTASDLATIAWVPLPAELAQPAQSEQSSGAPVTRQRQPALRQHTRLTVILNDATDSAKLAACRKLTNCYDVLAVQPLSDRAFASACTVLDVDVITMDFSCKRMPFRLRIALLREAIRRGIQFELVYSPLLRDPGARSRVLANASQLVQLTGGKGILISSGARRAADLRGPLEAASLTTLLGMPHGAARDALLGTGHAVLHHGALRRSGGRCITVIPLEDTVAKDHLSEESQRWPDRQQTQPPASTIAMPAPMREAATDDGDAFITF